MREKILKIVGSLLLLVITILAYVLTWILEHLSTLGGIIIVGISFVGAILMWLDVEENNHPPHR